MGHKLSRGGRQHQHPQNHIQNPHLFPTPPTTSTTTTNTNNNPTPSPLLLPPPQPHIASTSSGTILYQPPPFMYSHYRTQHPNNIERVRRLRNILALRPPSPPPPFVDHNSAKKIKNGVNVHKDTIKLVVDDKTLNTHLVSFTFDAVVDGSITIYYFAKEGGDCTFTPLYPEIYMPRRIPFQEGLGQKFSQPSGDGIDLGFFELDDLSKPSPEQDVFPLIISVETSLPSSSVGTEMSSHAQITLAVLDKNNEGHFQVRVIKHILWVDGTRYELRDIYGIDNFECVICLTEPKNTAVLPCRHMCMCSNCAKELRLQSNKCPVCRQPCQELIEIKGREESS